jgi:hypothetical protein
MRSATVLLSEARRGARRYARRDASFRRSVAATGPKTRTGERRNTPSIAAIRRGASCLRTTRRRLRPLAPLPTASGFLAAVIH